MLLLFQGDGLENEKAFLEQQLRLVQGTSHGNL